MYVGQSSNLLKRLSTYFTIGNGSRSANVTSRFEKAISLDGSQSFCLIVLCYVPSDYLDYMETF